MKRRIFCSILLFFVSVVSYGSENMPFMIKIDHECLHKYYLWKELSRQYGDLQLRSLLNHKIAYVLSHYFLEDPKPRTKGLVSLGSILLKKALINTKKLEEEKNNGELWGQSSAHNFQPNRYPDFLIRKSGKAERFKYLALQKKEHSSSESDGALWDDID